ncbi:MAG: hypothetical protein D4S01_05575 [Dehalococcoidia bacterium]|nr:MAG: hypothetical protein D4S01_05575 [Dehalococcoidia bacterium]
MIKENKHYIMVFPLDKSEGTILNLLTPKQLRNELRKMLRNISENINHCPNCGGLLPEIGFTFEGKKYHFTCYKIVNEMDVKVAETDYDKFCKYHKNSKS